MSRISGVLLLVLASALWAETVRGPVVEITTVGPADLAGVEHSLRLDEILIVGVDPDPRFLEGLEIEVRVPPVVRNQPGSVGITGLVSLTPAPVKQVMSLQGAQVLADPLLRAQRAFYQIPLYPGTSLRSSAGTKVLDRVVPPASFPLALSFTDIAKGSSVPRESTAFQVQIRPIVRDLGAVALRFETEDGEEVLPRDEEPAAVRVLIDGEEIAADVTDIVLPTGLHEVSLRSDTYLESSQTFGVERGKVLELPVPLVRPKALVRLDAPRGAEVFVDGIKAGDSTVELDEGDHVALVRIGDYSISRRFTVARKKSYIISVSLDIIVNEVE